MKCECENQSGRYIGSECKDCGGFVMASTASACSGDAEALIAHFGGLGSGTVGDAIIKYLGSSDCSLATRNRIWEECERLDDVAQRKFEDTLNLTELF